VAHGKGDSMNTDHEAERRRALNAIADRFGEWDNWLKGYLSSLAEMGINPIFYGNPAPSFWVEINKCEHDFQPRWFITAAGVRLHKYQCEKCLDQRGVISKSKMIELGLDTNLLKEITPFEWEYKSPLRDLLLKKGEEVVSEMRAEIEKARLSESANRKAFYESYINSDAWQIVRQKVLKRANWICEGCGTAKATQVHHLTYDRLGNEMLFDLVAVCAACHREIHKDKLEVTHE
jgi:hypothetical protein